MVWTFIQEGTWQLNRKSESLGTLKRAADRNLHHESGRKLWVSRGWKMEGLSLWYTFPLGTWTVQAMGECLSLPRAGADLVSGGEYIRRSSIRLCFAYTPRPNGDRRKIFLILTHRRHYGNLPANSDAGHRLGEAPKWYLWSNQERGWAPKARTKRWAGSMLLPWLRAGCPCFLGWTQKDVAWFLSPAGVLKPGVVLHSEHRQPKAQLAVAAFCQQKSMDIRSVLHELWLCYCTPVWTTKWDLISKPKKNQNPQSKHLLPLRDSLKFIWNQRRA